MTVQDLYDELADRLERAIAAADEGSLVGFTRNALVGRLVARGCRKALRGRDRDRELAIEEYERIFQEVLDGVWSELARPGLPAARSPN